MKLTVRKGANGAFFYSYAADSARKMGLDKEICIDCEACDSVCPVDVIQWEATA